jgi:hypothetical protein
VSRTERFISIIFIVALGFAERPQDLELVAAGVVIPHGLPIAGWNYLRGETTAIRQWNSFFILHFEDDSTPSRDVFAFKLFDPVLNAGHDFLLIVRVAPMLLLGFPEN